MTYQQQYDCLLEAIRRGPVEQQELVRMTDMAYAFLDEFEEGVTEEEVLGLRVLIAHAESLLIRYFGM